MKCILGPTIQVSGGNIILLPAQPAVGKSSAIKKGGAVSLLTGALFNVSQEKILVGYGFYK